MNKNKLKKRYIALIALAVIIAGGFLFQKQLAVLAFDLFLSDRVEAKLKEESYVPLVKDSTTTVKPEPVVFKSDPFSLMLLGTDQRGNETARSDTMIYAVVRPEDYKLLLISIPRDTYTEIIGHRDNKKDKITHAYAFGGQQMAKDTLEALLGHDIQYYATINFQGLKDAVDAIGGVPLPIKKDIVNKGADHEKFTIEGGKSNYNGEEALNYTRYREDSDFNRTKRQQVFIDVVANKMLSISQIGKIPELLDIMGENFKTDMEPSLIISLAKKFMGGKDMDISSFTVMGEGKKIDGVYYDIVDEEDLSEAQAMIDNWMNASTPVSQLIEPGKAANALEPKATATAE
ncbi:MULTISPECIES: LCP family protein [unclassified Paenibacillus]|uniref:LCP family protein n=1 Tax=unclassified Paenibacillus TaxID=185978 RepID=UPI0024065195|nr:MULTISPECIES: LCP family protein [unclassified Paenibacillus]MDF9839719.1 LCP family protein required for cell wall assembly [Paenibacillus sp. PastF-2]MDF9846299.1 LCP family protein required for cell wall assembly [Paenibacillus sp. PastM-2]MDF9853351.1 LCP family protein required for cell wall assembly [Paenibacillus sp. PastF-1]MDH6478145.1 LCP family protein required for cell wall assembly [Paenibacillus sp. PastH-2]MDH6506356.1 LCP family protein required for cell wall assembly [Paeni